ncbi:MAG: acyl carrier protein [Proteobacteria bacterium]|jgi:acyl carrier protein|nr:acyl carrier protein [Alphaproteobacteria bacterium]NCC02815.1 acyl carrier protein [Pseudomonadota bacterium]
MTNLETLASCFRDVLELHSAFPVETLAYQEHPAWDSVAHMRLIAAIETAFDIMMDTDQILGMSSFEKAKEILASHDIDLAS